MYPLILFIISVIAAFIHYAISRRRSIVELLLVYMIPLCIGIEGLIAFLGHVFDGPAIAAKIGWPAHNPFQFEVGMANLALGVAGIASIWLRGKFWLATTLIAAVFLLGAAYGHFVQMIEFDNYSPYNTGVFVYIGDIAIPVIYLTLAIIYSARRRFFCK